MHTALALAPPHISIYHLTIEPNTVFAKFPPVIPEDDMAYAMLDRLTELTGVAGLQRYEVSAYARPGHRCWHNLNYWQFGDYLGIGAGAHSKLSFAHRVVRQVRWREPLGYMDHALAGQAVTQDDEVARADLPFEFMLNALRLKGGLCPAGLHRAHRLAGDRHPGGPGGGGRQGPDSARLHPRAPDRAGFRLPERSAGAFPAAPEAFTRRTQSVLQSTGEVLKR